MSAAKYAPEWETESQRSVALGYEPPGDSWVRCLEHGYPTPLARWHRHEEYELHLIVETSGRAFIRDYVGSFSAGNVFLTGPGVPHNWVSDRLPLHGTPLRDLVMQFSGGPVCRARKIYPELRELAQMLERARAGVEFVGAADLVERAYHRIRQGQGLARLAEFLKLLGELAAWEDFRVLSSAPVLNVKREEVPPPISRVLAHLAEHFAEECTSAAMARLAGMSDMAFSREFKRVTGLTVPDYIARLRIDRACLLLMETDLTISTVAYEAGFNNLANFNRRFLRFKGISPAKFRREARVRFEGSPM